MTASRIAEIRASLRIYVESRGNTWTQWEARNSNVVRPPAVCWGTG